MIPLKLNNLSYKMIILFTRYNKIKVNSIFSKRSKNKYFFNNQMSMININNLGIVFGIFLFNYKKLINVIKFSNGIISISKGINGLFSGDFVKLLSLPLKVYKLSLLGCVIPLKFLKSNFIFSNISFFGSKQKYITSNGTFGTLISKNSELGLVLLRLPSGQKIYLKDTLFCMLGRNSLLNFKYTIFGKSGLKRNLGKNVVVRGVAKNPVDHPHGGRTKTNQPEVSPWGWIAKHNK